MRTLRLLLCIFFALTGIFPAAAVTNPRAHYADGQVWVVWTADTNAPPLTYQIYKKTTLPVWTNVIQGVLVGQLFAGEWRGDRMTNQVKTGIGITVTGFTIPTNGATYMLKFEEGLFVDTVRPNPSPCAYAVVPAGTTNINAAWISNILLPTYSTNEPPQMQLQASGVDFDFLGRSYPVKYYVVWADGDTNEAAGRPDFPITANAAKRGSPHLYVVSEPSGGLAGRTNVTATYAFHGGNDNPNEWLPGNYDSLSINHLPTDGYLIAPDEKLWFMQAGSLTASDTGYLGYVRGFDPLADPFLTATNEAMLNPPANETIVNYTQRQLVWVMDWFIREKSVDRKRFSLIGHSNGSRGACQLARAYPERFSVVEFFNNAMRYSSVARRIPLHGNDVLNLPVTLTNRSGLPLHFLDVLTMNTPLSAARDLPFLRLFLGKCDTQDDMHWGTDVVQYLRDADRIGWGFHFYWDLRKHGKNEWKDYWSDSTTPTSLALQTQRDDVSNLTRYRLDQSFPAFMNLQDYPNHGDPGPGYLGGTNVNADCIATNLNNGNDHGTWGGYFDWQTNIVDTPTNWACTLFLVNSNSGYAAVDACPNPFLRTDVAIRRPQQFNPPANSILNWQLQLVTNGAVLQSGNVVVGADNLIVVTNLFITRDPQRTRLVVSTPSSASLFVSYSAGEPFINWQGNSAFSSQLEHSADLFNWEQLDLPAQETDAVMSLQIPPYLLDDDQHFFRLTRHPLVTSAIPTATGFYTNQTFVHGGIARNYYLQVPNGWNAGTNWPFILVLPGHGQSIATFAYQLSEFRNRCATNGVILVFAEATAGIDSYKWFASENPHLTQPYIDDAAFLLALMDALKASGLNVNTNRCYLAGFSNGGSMTHYMASRTNHPFAAFAIMESGTAQVTHYREPYNRLDPDAGDYVVADTPLPSARRPVFLMNMTTSFPWPHEGRAPIRGSRENVSRWTFVNGYGAPVTNVALGIIEPTNALSTTISNWTATGIARARIAYGDMRPDWNWPTNLYNNGWAISNLAHFIYSTQDGTNTINQRLPAWVATNYPHTISPDPVDPSHFVRVDAGTMKVEIWRTALTNRVNEVIFVTLSDGGHQWPEAADKLPFDASDELLKFFSVH